jgi:hypothetical protein
MNSLGKDINRNTVDSRIESIKRNLSGSKKKRGKILA